MLDARTGVYIGFVGDEELSNSCGLKTVAAIGGRSLLFVRDFENRNVENFDM